MISLVTSLRILLCLFLGINSGHCLNTVREVSHNPNYTNGDISWIEIDDNIYTTTLIYDVNTIRISQGTAPAAWAEITSRFHNGTFPSPTLRVKRGNQYQIKLINNLGGESPNNPTDEDMNVFKDPNTTNIHTHGLHISGESPGDSVFTKINPGESYTYIYNIICNHAGGLFWYHPHHHGSTSMQVGSGVAGALIVEYDKDFEGLPDWLINMKETVMIIQRIDLRFLNSIYANNVDYVYQYDTGRKGTTEFWTVKS